MNISQVAQFLGFSKQKIYRLITSKKLIAQLIYSDSFPPSYYIKPEDFEFFLQQLYI